MWIVLGGSGFLGPALRAARPRDEFLFTHNAHPREGSVPFDVRSSSVRELLSAAGKRPKAALILAGVTNIDACARDPQGTREINVEGIVRIIDELIKLGVTPVFTSSDAVFDGSRAMWREEEKVRPILTYGRQKLEVENYLAAGKSPSLTVRLPKLLMETRNPRCMITGWVEALGRGEEIRCATDQFFTPASAVDAAAALLDLAEAGETGLYHLGGPERLGRRELLGAVLDEYAKHRAPKARIVECSLRDIAVLEPRPLDQSMDTSRYRALGRTRLRPASEIACLSVRDSLKL